MVLFKRVFLFLFFALISLTISAQSGSVKGVVVDIESGVSVQGAFVVLQNAETDIEVYSTISDNEGKFEILDIENGNYLLLVESQYFETFTQEILIDGKEIELGKLEIMSSQGEDQLQADDIIPTISIDNSDLENASTGQQGVSGLLTSSRDVFISTAAFTFGQYRFRIRGLGSEETDVFMDGILMSDLESGSVYWGQWGGLNDVMRNRENTIGLGNTDYTVGGIAGATQTITRASEQRKQFRVSYAAANKSYRNRIMSTYSTGLTKKGWAVSLAASRRWAKEGYVEGTSYDAWSYFMAVEKVFNDRNALNLTVFGAPNKRGTSSATVQEAYDLSGLSSDDSDGNFFSRIKNFYDKGSNFYNPNWGYQNGEKRNVRVSHSHLPTFILSHNFEINDHSSLHTSAAYQFGSNGKTALNWYNASDPRPDYYRNLPSYIENDRLRLEAIDNIKQDPSILQIDFDRLYSVNAISEEYIENVNGSGRDTTVNLSRYMIEDKRYDRKKFNFNTYYNNRLAEFFTLQVGANFNWQRTYNYKLVDDLLGGSVFIDRNQFAERDFVGNEVAAQNDLDRPNRLLSEGDKFGYDYNITTLYSNAWAQGIFEFEHWEVFAAGELSHTRYYRTGNVRNGLFPSDSKGDSEKKDFLNYTAKAGLTYKVNGRNYLFANGAYQTKAPYARNAFVSSRTRNEYVDNLENQINYSFEGGYILRAPKVKARAVFYYNQMENGINTYRFYYDLDRNFVNIALSNIDTRHLGGEFAVKAELFSGFSISGVAALGQYIYTSRQNADITVDNSSEIVAEDLTIYSKNFFVSGTPQMASSIGLHYDSPKYWFVNLNFNYFDRIFIDFNEVRRTEEALDLIEVGSEQYDRTIGQEQVKAQYTLDLFGGVSWKMNNTFKNMKRDYFMFFTLGVNNILNNTDFITGGYEQTRLDFDEGNLDKFPSRYYYSYGTNFFLNITFKM